MNLKKNFTLRAYEKERISYVREFILAHLDKHLTAGSLAPEAGISVYKLTKGFRLVTGKKLPDFIKEQRMEKAKELLLHTNGPIKAIAALCGYRNDTSFHRAFKKYTSYTPDDFRKL